MPDFLITAGEYPVREENRLMPYSACLVILTLNEIEGLRKLYDRIPFSKVEEILVVDGGSTDGTLEFLAEKGLRVVKQEKKGRGEAFIVAEKNSTSPWLVFFSPDGNENPEDIPKLLQKLEEGADLVIASRFAKGARNEEDEALLPLRLWANKMYTWLANSFFNRGPYVTDTINGFRAIKRESFRKLNLSESRFPIEYQMTTRCMKAGFKIAEIPTIEGDRIGGKSKARSIPVGLGHLKVLLQELFGGFPKKD
ncbi:MAG: glycosyltransferase [Candidatus Eremiobacteraeota bacterium]|nr:glycosyltransferase [Candidatus Eremiobacteraeota bacterium]